MAKGFTLSVAADTRTFKTAVDKGITEPLEDAAEILEEIGRDGGRDIEQVEASMRDARDASDDTKRAVEKLQEQIRSTGRGAKGDLSKPMKEAADETSQAFEQVRDDGFSNAKEVAASFDGSAESIAEGFQGAAAEAFSGFGPAGAVAGLAAAAGLGLALQAITEQQEAADELREKLASAYQEAAEAGRTFLDEAQIIGEVSSILFDDSRREEVARYREEAAKAGIDVMTYIRARAGDFDALSFSLETAKAEEADLTRQAEEGWLNGRDLARLGDLTLLNDELAGLSDQHRENQANAELYDQFVSESEKRQRAEIKQTTDTQRARVAIIKEDLASLPQSITVPLTVDTSGAEREVQAWLRKPRQFTAGAIVRYGREVV